MISLLAVIDRRLTARRLLWLVPLLLAVHNAEEAVTMPRWVMTHMSLIRDALPWNVDLSFTPPQLLASVSVATVVPFILAFIADHAPGKPARIIPIILVQVLVLLNAIVPHLYLSLRYHVYNPGVVTALLVNIPFSLYFLGGIVQKGILGRRGRLWTILGAIPIYPVVAYLLHGSGDLIARFIT